MKTVADLIAELSKLDPTLIVAMSSDEEGNSVDSWSGDISFAYYNADEDRGYQFDTWLYDDDDNEIVVDEKTATAVIIWP